MLSPEEHDDVTAAATSIYNDTMCNGAGCCGDIDAAIAKAIQMTEHLMLKKAAEGLDWEKYEPDSETSVGAIYYDDNPGF